MQKTSLSLLLSLVSCGALAAQGGTSVNWQQDYNDLVNMNCTGLVLGGNKVLTAGHCDATNNTTNLQFSSGATLNSTSLVKHPNYTYSGSYQYDVAILSLPSKVDTESIHFFGDITNRTVSVGNKLKAYGFGGGNPLAYVEHDVTQIWGGPGIDTTITAQATYVGDALLGGDSGGMWTNTTNRIVGLSSTSNGAGRASFTDLFYAKDFILDTVDGWHYPTIAKTVNNQVTITVQSLHKNTTSDSAYTDGTAQIVGGTCQGNNSVSPLDVCTYVVNSTGEGKLYLSANEFVHINKPASTTNSSTTSGGGSGGGSLGLSVFLLTLLGFRRKWSD